MSNERYNIDLDIPGENIVVCKDIDDILNDLHLSSSDRELYKDIILDLEKVMYDAFKEDYCVSLPYICRFIRNIGKGNLFKNKKYLHGATHSEEKGKIIDALYYGPFRELARRRKEERQAAIEQKEKEKELRVMRRKNKFKFNIGVETKLSVANYDFRKNYVKPGTFQFVAKNGKNKYRKNTDD